MHICLKQLRFYCVQCMLCCMCVGLGLIQYESWVRQGNDKSSTSPQPISPDSSPETQKNTNTVQVIK